MFVFCKATRPARNPHNMDRVADHVGGALHAFGASRHAVRPYTRVRTRSVAYSPFPILISGDFETLAIVILDPHAILVNPTIFDFANAECCHEQTDPGAAGSGGASRNSAGSYHDAGSFGSGVVSLTISHRKV